MDQDTLRLRIWESYQHDSGCLPHGYEFDYADLRRTLKHLQQLPEAEREQLVREAVRQDADDAVVWLREALQEHQQQPEGA